MVFMGEREGTMRKTGLALVSLISLVGVAWAQQATSTTGEKQAVKEAVRPPRLLKDILPDYPYEARQIGSGICSVALTVDVEGRPEDVHLVRCTDPIFAKNTLLTVSKYRFAPATTPDGAPVEASLTVRVVFRLEGSGIPEAPVRCGFGTPPNTASTDADSAGVYPLTKLLDPPKMTDFVDRGYEETAFGLQGVGACDVVLTIDQKGNPSNVGTVHCEQDSLKNSAAESLLKSHYKPARLNGKPVPVRASVHLALGDTPSNP